MAECPPPYDMYIARSYSGLNNLKCAAGDPAVLETELVRMTSERDEFSRKRNLVITKF